MQKKIIGLLTASVLLGSLCSCGSNVPQKTDRPKSQNSKTEESNVAEGASYIIKELKCYDADGNIKDQVTVEFNDQGFPVTVACNLKSMENGLYELEYDDQNGVIGYVIETVYCKSRIECDEHGNLIRETDLETGEVTGEFLYTYDEHGWCTEELGYNRFAEGLELDTKAEYVYDEAGNVTESRSEICTGYGPPGPSTNTAIYKYNENGYVESEEWTHTDLYLNTSSSNTRYEYIYDTDGNVVEQITNSEWPGEKVESSQKMTYGDGKLLCVEYDEYRQEYEYDQNGNIIKMYQYDQGELVLRYEFTYSEQSVQLTDAQKKVYSGLRSFLGRGDDWFKTTIINEMDNWQNFRLYY